MPSWLLYYVETGFGIRLFLGCLSLISFWSMIPAFLHGKVKTGYLMLSLSIVFLAFVLLLPDGQTAINLYYSVK